jgi:ABC-type nitrate/sulfonate/bicarbonate transport system substrate-binding protein
MPLTRRRALALAAAATLPAAPARAAETVRVGKTIVNSFPMAGIELGKEQGIFEKLGIDIVISTFRGDGMVQQAMTANSVDIGFGSGPGMGYAAKGVPGRAVAVMANEPRNMAMVVPKGGPVKTPADLKGKRVGVSTAGSLTDWLVRATSKRMGWGPEGITSVPTGDVRIRNIMMKNGDLEGSMTAIEEGKDYEESGQGFVLMNFGDVAPDFHTHVIFATDPFVKNKPDVLRTFLKGWFQTVAFMRDNRAATVKSIAKTTNYSEKIIDLSYDTEMKMISFDGAFSPKALDFLRQSFQELEILDFVPEVKDIYYPGFAPVSIK